MEESTEALPNMFCREHQYEYDIEDGCPGCQSIAEGQCRWNDTTLVINGETVTQIEDISLTRVSDGERGVNAEFLDGADMTFEGSFTVEFDDEADAKEFWDWLNNE